MRLRVDQKLLREAQRRRIVQTALEKSPVPPIAESPECGTEKVAITLRAAATRILRHAAITDVNDEGKSPYATGQWAGREVMNEKLMKQDAVDVASAIITFADNLQPGECCEVPAREGRSVESLASCIDRIQFHDDSTLVRRDGQVWSVYGPGEEPLGTTSTLESAIDTLEEFGCGPEGEDAAPVPSAPPVAESEGPRWKVDPQGYYAESCQTFLLRHGEFDMYFDGHNRTVRVSASGECWPAKIGEAVHYADAHFAARERARELGLIEAGPPKFPETEIPCGFTIGPFIGKFGAPRRNYYVAKNGDGRDIIIRRGDGGWMGLVSTDGDRTARDWVESSPGDSDAQAFRAAYDRALSANQLPPHPRYAKPEGAEVFLGWFGSSRQLDAWAGQLKHVCRSEMVLFLVDSREWTWCGEKCAENNPAYMDALARARELRLPERAAAQKRVAAADAELAAAKAALAEIGGGA